MPSFADVLGPIILRLSCPRDAELWSGTSSTGLLAPAYIFFSLSNLHNTIFMSSGRAKTALILMIINLTSVALALKLGLGSVTSESDLLSAAGRQICMAFAVVTVIGGLWLARVFEGYLSILSLARIIAAVGVAVFASQLTASGMSQVGIGETLGLKLTVLLSLPIYFFLVLWASGELNEEDRRLLGVFRRRGGGRREQDQWAFCLALALVLPLILSCSAANHQRLLKTRSIDIINSASR